ncbi:MAG: creatininase family protein [Geitlerinemataceae cyanobacterium]
MNGAIPPERFFPYLTWTEIEAMRARDRVVLVQPLGAIEQHGPHLPLVVDSTIACETIGAACRNLPEDLPCYVLPPLYYGKSNEHQNFPGTISLRAETLLATLHDIADSLHRAGFRRLIFANAHGGQPQIVEIAATDIHARYPDFWVFPVFIWRVPNETKSLLTQKERDRAMHAGDAETSFMLAVDAARVRCDRLVGEYPPDRAQLFGTKGALTYSWLTDDISRSGVVGDATLATREKGDRILASLAKGWAQAIADVYKFDPSPE